jgi:hypothetical protein
MERRTYLLTTAGAALTLAGCSDSTGDEPEDTGDSTTDSGGETDEDDSDNSDERQYPPTPQFNLGLRDGVLTITKGTGDDFDIAPAEIQYRLSVSGSSDITGAGTITDIGTDQAGSAEDALFGDAGSEPYVEFHSVESDRITDGDSFGFGVVDTTADADPTIESWTIELFWNPEGSDAELIFRADV